MATGLTIRKNQYYDSVFLMGINKQLSNREGVQQTAVLMGTEKNKELLKNLGFHANEILTATANDLIVAVISESEELNLELLADLDRILNSAVQETAAGSWHSLEDGLQQEPGANLAVFSIPGEFVYREAVKALESGLHAFIFSSNVSLEEERILKEMAASRGLLVMGPDCGTSLIAGKGLGFANAVRQGSIGVVGASGTGLQEFTCQVHNAGFGISHAIGTGTNDVSDQIGGLTALQAIDALEQDPSTAIIAFISKPPGSRTLKSLLKRLDSCAKPVVCCILGGGLPQDHTNAIHFAGTIDEAVAWASFLVSGNPAPQGITLSEEELALAEGEIARFGTEQKYLRGVFAGGTYCYQSQSIFQQVGLRIHSNAPLSSKYRLKDPDHSIAHTIIDMGDEFYTLGKPHPMIDGTLRRDRILRESLDPEVAVLFLDFILGYNAAPDPVGELLDALGQAQATSQKRGGHLSIVASICGTEQDSQDLHLQEKILRDQGAIIFRSNGKATAFCARLLKG